MLKKIKVGVIGTGPIATAAHLPVLASIPEVEIAAILSGHYPNAVNACKQFGGAKACKDLGEFLNQELDCAFLLTPKTVRTEYLLPLFSSGLHILCEKPLSMSLKECDLIANQAEKSGKIVMVAFNRRFAPANVGAIAPFQEQRPHMVIANKSREFKEYRGTLENAIHMVDLMRHILGECDYVEARAKFSDNYQEDCCSAILGFENGATGLLCASREAGQWREHVELYGNGITSVSDNLDSYKIIYPDKEVGETFTPRNKGWCTVVNRLGFENCIRHFLECCAQNKQPITSAQDAFKTHELMHRILKSAGLPDLSADV